MLNGFGIDAFNPGNWDYVYGSRRFVETFAGKSPQANWNAVAANLYYVTNDAEPQTFFPALGGQRVLPPYLIKQICGLKVGILGLTSDRGPTAVGRTVTKGFVFSRGETELGEFIPILRNVEQVDLLVVASELGLANNIRLAEQYPGIDVILSSDMHEETRKPVVTNTGTVVVEAGQDGTIVGELNLKVGNGRLESWRWTAHTISGNIPEDPRIAQAVKQARKPFVSGPDFVQHVNPFNGARLARPIDTVVGYTKVALDRHSSSGSDMPAVIEGSAPDFLTDAFRFVSKADIGAMRGFRYGTVVPPGPITLEDLYHFIAIGPEIGVVRIQGRWLKRQLEIPLKGRWTRTPQTGPAAGCSPTAVSRSISTLTSLPEPLFGFPEIQPARRQAELVHPLRPLPDARRFSASMSASRIFSEELPNELQKPTRFQGHADDQGFQVRAPA
jgi:S-sulfosulfanyl-L-cysteine sulfohydrolase